MSGENFSKVHLRGSEPLENRAGI